MLKTYTEAEIKAMCTPDIIKKMVELAEGFKIVKHPMCELVFFDSIMSDNCISLASLNQHVLFPLLIHRAVDRLGIKDINIYRCKYMNIDYIFNESTDMKYNIEDYQPENLTQLELALPHCLIVIFKEGKLEVV